MNEALLVQLGLFTLALEIIHKKRKDYSGPKDPYRNLRMAAAVGVEPWRGVMVRRMDKISRRVSILSSGDKPAVNESVLDSLVDEVNYLAIEAGLLLEKDGATLADVMAAAYRLPNLVASILTATPVPATMPR
jgi:hypothetical protein